MPRLHKKKIKGQKSGVWALPPKSAPATVSSPALAVERRAFVRHFCDIGAVVDAWSAKIENISRGGLKVVIGRRYEVGAILKVEVPKPGDEEFSLLLARVVHVAPEPNGSWGLGCAFTQLLSQEELEDLFINRGCG